MDKIEKIRQEIERRIQRENEILWNAKLRGTYPSPSCEYNLLTLTSLRDFIDTLSEEPDKSLEEAAKEYAEGPECTWVGTTALEEAFKAGAEWQYQKDRGKFAQIKAKTWSEGFDAHKEQMLKDAVEGYMDKDHIVTEGPFYYIRSRNLDLPNGLKEGDKVSIVFLKTEEE